MEWVAAQPWCNGQGGHRGRLRARASRRIQAVTARPTSSGRRGGERRDRRTLTDATGAERRRDARPRPRSGSLKRGVYGRADGRVRAPGSSIARSLAVAAVSGHRTGAIQGRTRWRCFHHGRLVRHLRRRAADAARVSGPDPVPRGRRARAGHGGRATTDLAVSRSNRPRRARRRPTGSITGSRASATAHSMRPAIRYYLHGRRSPNPKAPGNVWKKAETWPVAHQPRRRIIFRFGGDLTLERRPAESEAARSYTYNPQRTGPHHRRRDHGAEAGALRPAAADSAAAISSGSQPRCSTLPWRSRGTSAGRALDQLGRARHDLHGASCIDIYPDGYEALMLDSATHGPLPRRLRQCRRPWNLGRPYKADGRAGQHGRRSSIAGTGSAYTSRAAAR